MTASAPAVRLPPDVLPSGPAEITPQWLTATLGHRVVGQAGLAAIRVDRVGSGRGHIGSSFRARLTYHDRPEGAPDSVVVKLPALTAESRRTAQRGRLYEREVRFFSELADGVDLGAPRCFAAGHDPASDRFALVLADMTGRRHVDQVDGCPVELAELALRRLARTHARWWGDERLVDLPWLTTFSNPNRVNNLLGLGNTGWPLLCDALADRLGQRARGIGDAVIGLLPKAMARLDDLPQSLLHGDPRLDNMMFDAGAARVPVVLLDWQNASRGAAASDVCYFLVQNLSMDDFRDHRADLLASYHRELVASGVAGLSLAELTGSLPFVLPVVFAVAASLFVVGNRHEVRTAELAAVMAERALSATEQIGTPVA